MRNIKELDIINSIQKRKLIYKESWLDIFDKIIIYLFFLWGGILPFLIFFDPYRDFSKTGFEYYLLFFWTIFCAYVIYRKATEKKLTKIRSNYTLEKNREIITEYFEQNNYEKYRNASNILIYNEENDFSFNPNHQTSRIILLDNNDVYTTVIKENFRLNIPVLYKHISLRKELRKLLN